MSTESALAVLRLRLTGEHYEIGRAQADMPELPVLGEHMTRTFI